MSDSPTNFTSAQPLYSISWHDLVKIGRRHLRLFLLCFVPIFLTSVIYIWVTPRVYESAAAVQVEQRLEPTIKSLDKDSDDTEDLKSEDSMKTIEQNLQNFGLFLAVARDPNIANDPDLLVGFPKNGNPSVPQDVAGWLRSSTKVALRHGTRLIDITVEHRVPAMAQKLAQAIVDNFVAITTQAQNTSGQNALKLLLAGSDQVKAGLQKSEDALETYKTALQLKDRIEDQQRVVDALKQRYESQYPQLLQAQALLNDLLQGFDQEFQKQISNSPVDDEREYWVLARAAIVEAPADQRIPTELKLVEARADVLQKEIDTESALFDNILRQMRETDVRQDSAPEEIQLVEAPSFPERPARPKKAVILLLGLAVGIAAGSGAVALVQSGDTSFQSPLEAESLLGLPVLGTIMELPSRKIVPGAPSPPPTERRVAASLKPMEEVVMVADPGGYVAEGFRSLRAVINLSGKASPHHSILFTSALPGEGKTFVSCNYALSLAQANVRTLLVDCDLRLPAVGARFNLSNEIGLAEVLTGSIDFNKAVRANVVKNLDILCAGGPCANPAELFVGTAFADFLQRAMNEYDRVVLDTSPVNVVSDCLQIVNSVDYVCLVIRSASTSKQAPRHALTLLRRVHKEPLGIVMNALPPGADRAYLGYKGKSAGTYGTAYG